MRRSPSRVAWWLLAGLLLILTLPLLIGSVHLARWLLYGDGSLDLAAGAISIVDGDTFDIGNERWRPTGYDAPEIRNAKCPEERALGVAASFRLQHLISTAQTIRATPKRRRVSGKLTKDKWGRQLGTLTVDGRDVGSILIAEGLARPYNGGRRESWCPLLPITPPSPRS